MIPPRFQGARHTARSLALQVLLDAGRHEGFIQEILDRHLTHEAGRSLAPPDRRLATHLAYGVLRRRGTLQALLAPLVSRPVEKVEPWLWEALGIGVYQLALLTQIPAHAALNETVELAALFGRPGAKGFLNGILRSCAALITNDRTEAPAADALPLEGGHYRRLARGVLPDPAEHPVEYLAHGFSLPPWLARRWFDRFGRDEAFRLGFWFAGPAPLTLRVNLLRQTREGLLQALTAAGFRAEAGGQPLAVRLREPTAVREITGYSEGWFSVQDESAMGVGAALAPRAGSRVLDLCAAPGGKTTHLGEQMGDRGRIVACDIDEQRLKTLRDLAGRLGLSCIETRPIDASRPLLEETDFDAVLVDVPCSNTGVLGRRPEVRWRLGPFDLEHLERLQERLLRFALEKVKRGGVVVYSTCSIESEENGDLVRRVLAERRNAALEAEEWSIPGRPSDGGYWARLRKVTAS